MIMLIIALNVVPTDVTKFNVDLPQTGSPMLISSRNEKLKP